MTPDLVSLRLLVAVGHAGSLSRSARSLGISQPAASKRLSQLERTLGMALVIRTPTGSQLTGEGRVVADWSRRVLDTVDEMLDAVASLQAHMDSDLRVAASMTVAEHLVPDWLSELRRTSPGVHVGLRVANSQEVQRLVLADQADIGFVETPDLDPGLTTQQVGRDRLAVVVAPDHPWARLRRPLTRDELAGAPLIVRERGSGTRETLERLLSGASVSRPPLELGSNAAVKAAARGGSGPAALSVLAISAELASGQLVEVEVDGLDLTRRLHAVWPRNRALVGPSADLLRTAVDGAG